MRLGKPARAFKRLRSKRLESISPGAFLFPQTLSLGSLAVMLLDIGKLF